MTTRRTPHNLHRLRPQALKMARRHAARGRGSQATKARPTAHSAKRPQVAVKEATTRQATSTGRLGKGDGSPEGALAASGFLR